MAREMGKIGTSQKQQNWGVNHAIPGGMEKRNSQCLFLGFSLLGFAGRLVLQLIDETKDSFQRFFLFSLAGGPVIRLTDDAKALLQRFSMVFLILVGLCQPLRGQGLSAAMEGELKETGALTRFTMMPRALVLLPSFPEAPIIVQDHEKLKAHARQEALFYYPVGTMPSSITLPQALLLMDQAGSLSNLSYWDAKKGIIPLFKKVSELPFPERSNAFERKFQVEDVEFGTILFHASLRFMNQDGIHLRMENLSPLRFLWFPAVPERQALIDLFYLPSEKGVYIYTVWSVRVTLFVPIENLVAPPLYYRAMALKEWFQKHMETIGR